MIRLGILGCSNIAFNRFMPAALKVDGLQVTAIAEQYDKSKLETFGEKYPLETEENFDTLINRPDIDAVYVPQPPAFHFEWAKKALEAGKHVLVEKPSTTSYEQSKELVDIAGSKKLALHENYMFQYHFQIKTIQDIVASGTIGDVRMYKLFFGFPLRAANDFRYIKNLGGGALLDAGGYPVRLATVFLGDKVKVDTAKLNSLPGYEVDMYGSAVLSNDKGMVAQIGFGMDNAYQCSLEIWGSKGTLRADRIFTSPDGFEPTVTITSNEGADAKKLPADSHFQHSIEHFLDEIRDAKARQKMYQQITTQARLIDEIRRMGS